MDRTQRVGRRHFLRTSGRAIAGLAGLLAGQPPAAWAARELSLLTAVRSDSSRAAHAAGGCPASNPASPAIARPLVRRKCRRPTLCVRSMPHLLARSDGECYIVGPP